MNCSQQDVASIIAKVVFCSATSIETRKFAVHNKDFKNFCALVHESLQYYSDSTMSYYGDESIEMFYQSVESNQWVHFDCESQWEQAKEMFAPTNRKSSVDAPHNETAASTLEKEEEGKSSKSTNHKKTKKSSSSCRSLKIKVQLYDKCVDIKQHCSLNSRNSNCSSSSSNRSSSKRHSRSAPSALYFAPTKQELTVSFSNFEDLKRIMEERNKAEAAEAEQLEKNISSSQKTSVNRRKKHSSSRSSGDESTKKKKRTETTTLSPKSRKSSRTEATSCALQQQSSSFHFSDLWGECNNWAGHSNTSSII